MLRGGPSRPSICGVFYGQSVRLSNRFVKSNRALFSGERLTMLIKDTRLYWFLLHNDHALRHTCSDPRYSVINSWQLCVRIMLR